MCPGTTRGDAVQVAPNNSIRPPSLGITAHELLRDKVLNLDIAPGTRLLVDDIAREFGVSRTPIRDAIRLLINDGLATMTPQGVAHVRRPEPHLISDVFEVRLPLECLAVRRAASRLPPEALAAARRAVEAARDAAPEPEGSRVFFESDDRLHGLMVAHADNEVLQTTLRQLGIQIQWLRRLTYQGRPMDVRATCEEHLGILDALQAGDAAEAERRMGLHLERAQERLSP
jgi:DNA-binding GntR family transcriptional regulator